MDNTYVLKKLFKIVVPFVKSKEEDYSQPSGWNDADYGMTKTEEQHHRTLLSPDLYIPLMSFMTFILMVCLSMGYRNEFRPELISNYTINCMFFAILEMLLYKLILLIVRVKTLSLLDITAFLNYKFVGLCLVLLAKFLIGGWITTGITIYFSISFVYYMYAELRSHAEGVAEGIDIGNYSFSFFPKKTMALIPSFLEIIQVKGSIGAYTNFVTIALLWLIVLYRVEPRLYNSWIISNFFLKIKSVPLSKLLLGKTNLKSDTIVYFLSGLQFATMWLLVVTMTR